MSSIKNALQFLLLTGLLGLAACSTNLATGRTQLVGMSARQEASVGATEHPKILEQFGGVYDEGDIGAYVAEIGGRLARNSEMADTRFRFTVLDTPMVNAFALPGGYIYVTRGLLALANSEAEIAGVIGHEIGHVTARHSAERYGQQMGAGLLGIGLGIFIGESWASDLYNVGATGFLANYSRNHEYESDMLAVRYLARTGYDPYAQGDFLNSLDLEANLQRDLSFSDSRDPSFDFFSTHPNTKDRVRRAFDLAKAEAAKGQTSFRNRNRYLRTIDGMTFGDGPEQGFIRGRVFEHPVMKFRFEVPEGFRLFNSASAIVAKSENQAMIAVTAVDNAQGQDPMGYLRSGFSDSIAFKDVQRIEVNGLEAATGIATVNTNAGTKAVRVVAIQLRPEMMISMLFMAAPDDMQALATEFRRTTYSFQRLTDQEAAALSPRRIRIVDVMPGDTVSKLARRMAFTQAQEPRFRALNGLGPNGQLKVGDKVKIVTE